MQRNPIYADQAATSFPKPAVVAERMAELLATVALSPGRAAHRYSLEAGRVVFAAREALAEFFGCPDSACIAFTANVTEALNTALFGLRDWWLRPGDHIVTTSLEHNSVMRPLRHLEKTLPLEISLLPLDREGEVDVGALPGLMREETRLIVVNHVSNVTGALVDLAAVGRQKGNALFLVDAAQSAGVFPIDVEAAGIDILAFTGHKALLGPTGTGGFCLQPGIDLKPLKLGGTGSNSEREVQPDFLPDRFEAGTPNTLGIGGLEAGVSFIRQTGLAVIRAHEQHLCRLFLEGLGGLPRVTVYGPDGTRERGAVVSLRAEGMSASDLALRLEREDGIMVRAGLQCAPAAHRALGTFPEGTVRFSFGYCNTEEEVARCLQALARLCG